MEPSSSNKTDEPPAGEQQLAMVAKSARAMVIDRVALGAIGLGITLYVVPWLPGVGLRWGFWLTFGGTVLHLYSAAAVARTAAACAAADCPAVPEEDSP